MLRSLTIFRNCKKPITASQTVLFNKWLKGIIRGRGGVKASGMSRNRLTTITSAIKNNGFMKFLDKWRYLEDIILNEITQSQKKSLDMHSLISGYSLKSLEYPRYNSQTTWSSRRRNTKVWVLQSFLEGRTKYSWEPIWRQSVEQKLKEKSSRDCPT